MYKIISLVLLLLFNSCTGKEKKEQTDIQSRQQTKSEYNPVAYTTNLIQDKNLVITNFDDSSLPFSIIVFKESEKSYLQVSSKLIAIDFDYTFNEDESINTSKILLFKNQSKYIILIPTFTEEFHAFQMVEFSKNEIKNLGFKTYGYEEFGKIKKDPKTKIKFIIDNYKNFPTIFAILKNDKIRFSQSSNSTSNSTSVSEKEKELIQNLNNNKRSKSISLDINSDGKDEVFEVDFNKKKVIGTSTVYHELGFEGSYFIIKKKIEEKTPHDIQHYKYYFQDSTTGILLNKIEFNREVYVENTDLCNVNYTYIPIKKTFISEVSLYNTNYLNELNRKFNLQELKELILNTNKKFQCANNIHLNELKFLFTNEPLNEKNLNEYNNIAYYLEQNKDYNESNYILDKIINKYPSRIVAWLNLADTYWELDEKAKAKDAYQKYTSLMKSQNKDLSKIPQRVYERSK